MLFFPVLFLLGSPPTVELPAEVRAQPGRLVTLTAKSDGRVIRWALASDEADLVPFPGGQTALFCAAKSGRYLVLAWTAAEDQPSEAARCVVIVGEAPPPHPPAPEPEDPLTRDFQRLYVNDPTPGKRLHLAQLAVLYREAVRFAERPEVQTAGELAQRIRQASASLLPADALIPLRKRIAEEISRLLPVDSTDLLDAGRRATAAQLFARIATSLEGLR
jgi:hypothetical protein